MYLTDDILLTAIVGISAAGILVLPFAFVCQSIVINEKSVIDSIKENSIYSGTIN
jgi:hypothetical protein